MLKIIRVSAEGPRLHAHEIPNPPLSFFEEKKVCILALVDHYDKSGEKLPGMCSKICKHGYLVCTDEFHVQFPIVIEGGLSDAKVGEEEEMRG